MRLRLTSFRTYIFIIIFTTLLTAITSFALLAIATVNTNIELFEESNQLIEENIIKTTYTNQLLQLQQILTQTTTNPIFVTEFDRKRLDYLQIWADNIRHSTDIDVIILTDENRRIVYSTLTHSNTAFFDTNDMVLTALQRNATITSTERITPNSLFFENPEFLVQTRIRPLALSATSPQSDENYYYTILGHVSVVPIISNGQVTGTVVGINVLNKDTTIPRLMQSLIHKDVTLFVDDLSITSSVMTRDGLAYTGIPFAQHQLAQAQYSYAHRIPLTNYKSDHIGTLIVEHSYEDSMLQKHYFSQSQINRLLVAISLSIILIALLVSFFSAKLFIRPIEKLTYSIDKAIQGDYNQGVNESVLFDELKLLARHHNVLIRDIRHRTKPHSYKYSEKKEGEDE